jgi:hypothetical protein
MKKKGPIKTTRLFSLQLADHDGLFAPKARRRHSFAWLKLLIYLPAAIFFFVPSYKIGRGALKDPGYKLPDTVMQGEVFTFPATEDDDVIPQMGGRSLSYIDGKAPMYIGAALGPTDFEINFQFNDDDKPRFKAMMEKLKHPTYPVFVKRIKVTKLPETPDPAPLRKGEEAPRTVPPFDEKETRILARTDGFIRMRCWKEPVVEPVGVDPLKPRRHLRMGSLPAVGQGEVLFAGPIATGESLVVVYHGGGLFTRYWGLKETRVQKGAKVTTGQTIGYIPLAPPKKETHATWQAVMNITGTPGEVSRPSLLALSSRLCDSK